MAHYGVIGHVVCLFVVVCLLSRLDVDGMSMLLAQGLVLLGVERLALQVHMAHLGTTGKTKTTIRNTRSEFPQLFLQ